MPTSVLFVDDEANILQSLKRTLRSMRDDWEIYYAESGAQALTIMKEHPIEVIASDLLMPGMDGAELLARVKQLHPETIRIIMSGYVDNDLSMRSVRLAHQFLAKPYTVESVKNTINRSIALRTALGNSNLVKLITGLEKIPCMPPLYKQLLEEINSTDPSIKNIASIISQDIAMTGRVLQLVNSAFFGLPHHISSAKQAATLLGVNTLKALVLSNHIFFSYGGSPPNQEYIKQLWHHSLLVAKLSKAIIETDKSTAFKADDAFVSGILHDIGKLLLLEVPEYSKYLVPESHSSLNETLQKETELLGATHGEAGGYFLGLWGIPNSILEPVIFHHHPCRSQNYSFDILAAVHVANVLMFQESLTDPGQPIPGLDYVYLNQAKLMDRLPGWLELAVKIKTEVGDYGDY